MSLSIQSVKRTFKFTRNSQDLNLADPNPEFTPEEVLTFYGNTYPELTTATLIGPKIENDSALYEFRTTVGTKG